MGYKKPLLIELLAELDLDAALPGDAVFDLAADLRRNGYPRIDLGPTLAMPPGLPGAVVAMPGALQTRLRCWSADDKKLVQVSPTQIVVNQIGDYLGWSDFKEMFGGVIGAAQKVGPLAASALSLQAIDQLAIDGPGFKLGSYFACKGTWIPQWYEDCAEACDISLGRGHVHEGGKNRQLALRLRPSPTGFVVKLNTIFKDKLRNSPPVEVLESLHKEATDLFEAVITDATRKKMGGK